MELNHVGKHCHMYDCRQLDFLPFKCGHCRNDFCLSHRSPDLHSCSNYVPPRPPVAIICKDCNQSVLAKRLHTDRKTEPATHTSEIFQLSPDNIQAQLQEHVNSGECKKFSLKALKPYCCTFVKKSGKTCKRRGFDEILCRKCRSNFCIQHRHAEDHNCVVLKREREEQKAKLARKREKTANIQSNKQIHSGSCRTEIVTARSRHERRVTNVAHSRLLLQS